MAITDNDVARVAKLACIALTPEGSARARDELNGILGLIEQLQAVDTAGVEPMAHPLSAHQEIALRLRDDEAAATHSLEQREILMGNSPAGTEQGLFLVPTVIE